MKLKIFTFIAILLTINSFLINGETIEEQLIRMKNKKIDNYDTSIINAKNKTEISDILELIMLENDILRYSEKDGKLVDLICKLSGEGVIERSYKWGSESEFTDIRKMSIEILSKIKGEKIRKTLINLLQKEKDLFLKIKVMNALCEVGDNENLDVLRALNDFYKKNVISNKILIPDFLNTVGCIARYNSLKIELFEESVNILLDIKNNERYTNEIRDIAYKVIFKISHN